MKEISEFEAALKLNFQSCMDLDSYIEATSLLLGEHGFTPDNTLGCVSSCRDELTRNFVDKVQEQWGDAFNFSSLGGVFISGKTGLGAALKHGPQQGGRERYVFFSMSHIGIDAAGELGQCVRPGRPDMSTACGALVAVRDELRSGSLNLSMMEDDLEQSLVRQKLAAEIKAGSVPSLLELTRMAQQIGLRDLEKVLRQGVRGKGVDYSIFGGIHIHGPNRVDWIEPQIGYVVIGGQRIEVDLRKEMHAN